MVIQVGDVFHHPASLVRDGQSVGAVGHQVEVADDEDDGNGKDSHHNQGDGHAQGPAWEDHELLRSLNTGK